MLLLLEYHLRDEKYCDSLRKQWIVNATGSINKSLIWKQRGAEVIIVYESLKKLKNVCYIEKDLTKCCMKPGTMFIPNSAIPFL